MKSLFTRLRHACSGILHATKHDFSFQWQAIVSVLVVILAIGVFYPLAPWEVVFVGFALTLILSTELQNSALEAALDRLHPELHDDIKRSKDMSAGAVLITGLYLLFVIVVISYVRFIS